jgi:hypothetical protein
MQEPHDKNVMLDNYLQTIDGSVSYISESHLRKLIKGHSINVSRGHGETITIKLQTGSNRKSLKKAVKSLQSFKS